MKITRRVKSCRRKITVECPFCSTINEVKVSGGSVEPVEETLCGHFKKVDDREVGLAVFERDARTSKVVCPYCGVRVEVEHWDGDVLDVKDPCEHFEREMENGELLFSDFQLRKV